MMTPENYNTWLAQTRVVSQQGDLLRIAVPKPFHRDWLENKLHRRIMTTMQRLGYTGMQVEYVVAAFGDAPELERETATTWRLIAPCRRSGNTWSW